RAGRGDARRQRRAAGRVGARSARHGAHGEGVGGGARPALRPAGRCEGPRPPGVAAPAAARPRGRVRRHDIGCRDRPCARGRGGAAGAIGGLMTAETLAVQPTTDRDAGWRDVAAVLGSRMLQRLRIIAGAVRPLAWLLMALAVGFWIVGQALGWAELTVAAVVIALTLALCALFLIGRTEYEVALDLARTRVVV